MIADCIEIIRILLQGISKIIGRNLKISSYIKGVNLFVINDNDFTIYISKVVYIQENNNIIIEDENIKNWHIKPHSKDGYMMHVNVPFKNKREAKVIKKKGCYIVNVFITPDLT